MNKANILCGIDTFLRNKFKCCFRHHSTFPAPIACSFLIFHLYVPSSWRFAQTTFYNSTLRVSSYQNSSSLTLAGSCSSFYASILLLSSIRALWNISQSPQNTVMKVFSIRRYIARVRVFRTIWFYIFIFILIQWFKKKYYFI